MAVIVDTPMETADPLGIILPYVKDGIAPFRPHRVTVYLDDEMTSLNRKVVLELEGAFPDFVFELAPWMMYANDYEYLMRKIGKDAFIFYRNRPRIEPDDHIVLGEN